MEPTTKGPDHHLGRVDSGSSDQVNDCDLDLASGSIRDFLDLGRRAPQVQALLKNR
jgi:hypothetical protein